MLEEKVAKAERKVEKLEEQINDIWDYQVDPERLKFTKIKIVELEDRSRRNNLPIDGITEKENETWDECEQEVQSLIKDKLKHRNRTSTPNKEKKRTVKIQENPQQ